MPIHRVKSSSSRAFRGGVQAKDPVVDTLGFLNPEQVWLLSNQLKLIRRHARGSWKLAKQFCMWSLDYAVVERFTEGMELMGAAEVQLQSDLIR